MTPNKQGKGKVKPGASEFWVLVRVYLATDCSNEVYDYATLHHSQLNIAEQLKRRGLLVSAQCVAVDGDGWIGDTERWGEGFRLTLKGYEALTLVDPEGYPKNLRRFAKSPTPRRKGKHE